MKVVTLLILFALVFAGCEQAVKQPVAGIVEYARDLTIGDSPSDLSFTSAEGKQTKFRKTSEPISVVTFISSTGRGCCRIDPGLAAMAERFKDDFITVVQISLPSSDCPHGAGCVEVCNLFDKHLVLLCDKDRIAWKTYRQPKSDTVFLINQDNEIVAIESIQKLNKIEHKAMELSEKIAEAVEDASQG